MTTTVGADTGRRLIFLLRHGDLGPEASSRFIGRTDLPLSKLGRAQARWWREDLARTSWSRIVASDLSRCRETAAILAEGQAVVVEERPEVREIDLGQWDGLTREDIKTRFAEEYRLRGLDLAGYRPAGGESFEDLDRRVWPMFEDLCRSRPGNILVVTHGGVNRVIICHLLGIPLNNLFRIGQDFGALNIVEAHGLDTIMLLAMNLPCRTVVKVKA
jgi:probable phosphoglycerate mutase